LGRQQPRDRRGRFDGPRVNVDQVPRLPIFPAQWTLEDPRGRTYLVFWTRHDEIVRALLMAPSDDGREVVLSTPYISRRRVALERRRQWGGQVIFYVCAGCNRPRRSLYPWEMINGRLLHDLNPRCAQCARLRYPCQGRRGPGTTVEPWASSRPSVEPWEPRAASDPRLVAAAFPSSFVILPE
jgi:hypothetical protein